MKKYTDDELDSLFKSGFEGHELKPSEGLFSKIQESNKKYKRRSPYWMIPLILLLGTGLSIGVFYFSNPDDVSLTNTIKNTISEPDENITGQQQIILANKGAGENQSEISEELTKPNLIKPEEVAVPVFSLESNTTLTLQETIQEENLSSEEIPSAHPLLNESVDQEPVIAELPSIEKTTDEQLPSVENEPIKKPSLVAGIYFSYAKPFTKYDFVENPELSKLRSENETFQNSKGIGAFISIPLSPKVRFNSGVAFRNQQVYYAYEKEIQNEILMTHIDTHLYRNPIQNRINIRYDTTYKRNTIISYEQLAGNYSLNYLTIPFDVSYNFLSFRRFTFTAGAGGGFDFLIGSSGSILNIQQDEVIQTNIKDANLNTVSIYTGAHAGIAYRFAPTYSLFIQPHFISSLPLNLNENGKKSSPNYLQFRAGIKKSL